MSEKADFFDTPEMGADDFIASMKQPREEIEAPDFSFPGEEEEEEPEHPEDREMLDALDFTEEHRFTAEFMLIQLDKLIGFGLSVFSGGESDDYRRRKVRMKGEDYEVEVLAALVKKYQMRLTLEWMFASALMIGYAPMVNKAMKDRKERVNESNEEARRQYLEMLRAQAQAEAVRPQPNVVDINGPQRRAGGDRDGEKRNG